MTIAFLDPDRQLMVRRTDGTVDSLTGGSPTLWGAWGATKPETDSSCSWPVWSPDARRIACFQIGDAARVMVCDADGVTSSEVVSVAGRLPIYLAWAPDGESLALLTQDEDRLHLSVARLDALGTERVMTEGSPLFFTWTGPSTLAAFVGGGNAGARLSTIDVRNRATNELPGLPGNFCAPVWCGDEIWYVEHHGGSARVVCARPDAAEPEVIDEVEGLAALVASPDGSTVAVAVAPDANGAPYSDLRLIDVATRSSRRLTDRGGLAFLWTPDQQSLLLARVDTERNLLEWHRIATADGADTHLIDMHPTRELGFYLRFFEQYVQSHQLVAPDSSHILLPGGVRGHGKLYGVPRVWAVPVLGGDPDIVADGVFGVYAGGDARWD